MKKKKKKILTEPNLAETNFFFLRRTVPRPKVRARVQTYVLTKYIFGNKYRPPSSNRLQFLKELNEILQIIAARFCNHAKQLVTKLLKAIFIWCTVMACAKDIASNHSYATTGSSIDHIWINRDDRKSSSSLWLMSFETLSFLSHLVHWKAYAIISLWLSDIIDDFPKFIFLKSSGTVRNDDILVRLRNINVDNRQLFSNRVYSFPWNDLLTSSSAGTLCGRF